MNDEMRNPELKSVIAEWMAPPPARNFHTRVLIAFDGEFGKIPWWRRWAGTFAPGERKGLLAGTALIACLFLLVVTRAFPQMTGLDAPPAGTLWTADSEFVRYAEDGSYSVEMNSRSYERNGNEILLSRYIPGNAFMTALGRTLDVATPVWSRFITSLTIDAGTLEKLRRARASGISLVTGCSAGCLFFDHYGWAKAADGGCIEGAAVGQATILNHATVAIQRRWMEHGRMTLWMAPDMACFALRATYEEQRPDGRFRTVSEKRVVKINPIP